MLKTARRELNKLPLHRTDRDQTQLNLENMNNDLLIPALKFIRYKNIHVVNFNNMKLQNEQLTLLAPYISSNPLLRSLSIAGNRFTDAGLTDVIDAMKSNTHLNHLNLKGCEELSDWSMKALNKMVTEINMSLYAIEMDEERFNPEVMASILE